MTVVAFDKLKFAKRLEDAGISPTHATATAYAFAEAVSDVLATKQDIVDLRRDLGDDIRVVREDVGDVRRDVRESELRSTIKVGAMLAGAVAALAMLIKLV